MKFTVFIRGRGWAFQLANSLNKKNNLDFLVTSYPKFIVKKYDIPKNKIKSVFILEIIVRSLRKIDKFLKNIKIILNPVNIVDVLADLIFSKFYKIQSDVYILGFGNSSSRLIKLAKKNKIKTIYFLNNSSPKFRSKLKDEYIKLGILEYYNKEKISLTKRINKNIQDADFVGCISSFQRDSYVEQGILDVNKTLTTIMGVDTSVFFPKKIKKDKFIVLSVGNDFVRKGLKYLIEGFNELDIKDSELWIVGNHDINLVSKLVKLKKNNIFINKVNEFDLPNYYNKASVFCLPTLEEGAPIVISQAMACGLPIIATKNCQAPDVLDNGKNGFIVEEKDSKDIGEKINFFCKNPKETLKMGEAAANYASKKLSYNAMADKITDFFENYKKNEFSKNIK
jgi:glycosyltransferase involved in cell wall biosynthesis